MVEHMNNNSSNNNNTYDTNTTSSQHLGQSLSLEKALIYYITNKIFKIIGFKPQDCRLLNSTELEKIFEILKGKKKVKNYLIPILINNDYILNSQSLNDVLNSSSSTTIGSGSGSGSGRGPSNSSSGSNSSIVSPAPMDTSHSSSGGNTVSQNNTLQPINNNNIHNLVNIEDIVKMTELKQFNKLNNTSNNSSNIEYSKTINIFEKCYNDVNLNYLNSIYINRLLSKTEYSNFLKVLHVCRYITYRCILKQFADMEIPRDLTTIITNNGSVLYDDHTKSLSLENLSKKFSVTRWHLHRVFKSFTGITIKDFENIINITICFNNRNYNILQKFILDNNIFKNPQQFYINFQDLDFWYSTLNLPQDDGNDDNDDNDHERQRHRELPILLQGFYIECVNDNPTKDLPPCSTTIYSQSFENNIGKITQNLLKMLNSFHLNDLNQCMSQLNMNSMKTGNSAKNLYNNIIYSNDNIHNPSSSKTDFYNSLSKKLQNNNSTSRGSMEGKIGKPALHTFSNNIYSDKFGKMNSSGSSNSYLQSQSAQTMAKGQNPNLVHPIPTVQNHLHHQHMEKPHQTYTPTQQQRMPAQSMSSVASGHSGFPHSFNYSSSNTPGSTNSRSGDYDTQGYKNNNTGKPPLPSQHNLQMGRQQMVGVNESTESIDLVGNQHNGFSLTSNPIIQNTQTPAVVSNNQHQIPSAAINTNEVNDQINYLAPSQQQFNTTVPTSYTPNMFFNPPSNSTNIMGGTQDMDNRSFSNFFFMNPTGTPLGFSPSGTNFLLKQSNSPNLPLFDNHANPNMGNNSNNSVLSSNHNQFTGGTPAQRQSILPGPSSNDHINTNNAGQNSTLNYAEQQHNANGIKLRSTETPLQYSNHQANDQGWPEQQKFSSNQSSSVFTPLPLSNGMIQQQTHISSPSTMESSNQDMSIQTTIKHEHDPNSQHDMNMDFFH